MNVEQHDLNKQSRSANHTNVRSERRSTRTRFHRRVSAECRVNYLNPIKRMNTSMTSSSDDQVIGPEYV